jgi:CHAD domain-containing protein
VGDVLTAYIAAQVRTLLEYDPRVRLAEYDSVHKMRVAVRRTRSTLRTYGRALDPDRTARLDEELRWLADTLGTVRDLEVLHERFERRLAEPEAAPGATPAWLADLEAQTGTAHRRLVTELEGERYFALLDALEGFLADPPVTAEASRKAERSLPRILTLAWRRVGRALDDAERLGAPAEREAARHRARRAAKRARYAAEAAVPVLGRAARDMVEQAERMQETLGGYQDALIARDRLAAMAEAALARGGPGERDAYALGLLIGTERCAAGRSLEEIAPAWRRASAAKNFRRLTAARARK